MSHHQYNRLRSKLYPFIKFALVIACLGLLASCGGGSGSTATMPTVQAPETINGIAVPLEPNPTVNNATLAGVDSNNNGVRDDAEIMIAAFSKKQTYENYSLEIAKLVQRLTIESIVDQVTYNTIMSKQICLDRQRPDLEKSVLSLSDIKNSVVNNRTRSAKYTENAKKYQQAFLPTGDVSCD